MLILPIPVQKIPEQKMLNDILNKNLKTNDTLVLGGCFSPEQQEAFGAQGTFHYLDFMKDEIVTEENAAGDGGGRDRGACA